MTPRLRRTQDGRIADEIRVLAGENPAWSAIQLHRELQDRHAADPAVVPSLRTIQRFLAEHPRDEDAERWSLTDWSADDAADVLELMRDLFVSARLGAGPRRPTKRQAELYVRIKRIEDRRPAPLNTALAWSLALYAALGDREREQVEELLVVRPWAEGPSRLQTMVKGGMVDDRAEALWRSIRAGQPANGGK